MMCREEGALGQNVEAKEDNGEGDEDKEDCEGTAPSATTSATSDVLWGPYMLAWLASLEKLLSQGSNG